MPLVADGPMATLEDLRDYESAIYELAGSEQIDLTKKLLLAQQEIELDLAEFLSRQEGGDPSAAVVSPALRQWHMFCALLLTYEDAYASHLNDRYQGKRQEYERLSKSARSRAYRMGIGMVSTPIPKAEPPAATGEPGNGPAGSYWLQMSWTGGAGEEGAASDAVEAAVAEGSALVVQAGEAPGTAAGWNVYAGLSAETTMLQNAEPLDPSQAWRMPDSGLISGRPAGDGQAPTYFVASRQVLERG